METHSTYQSLRRTRVEQWRGLEWPVNEILLQSLIVNGRNDRQIAELCGVEIEHVIRLRQVYDL